jgi:hypothetical protein
MQAARRYTYLVGVGIKAVGSAVPGAIYTETPYSWTLTQSGKSRKLHLLLTSRKGQIGRKYLLLHRYEWCIFHPCPVTVGYPDSNGELPNI